MKIDEQGVVTWTPKEKSASPTSVIILIKDDSGDQAFHRFDVPF